MNINEYRKLSGATREDLGTPLLNSIHCVLGITSEVLDEFMSATSRINEGEELGDANWYCAEYCNIWGIETPDKFYLHPDMEINTESIGEYIGALADLDKAALAYGREIDVQERAKLIIRIWTILEMFSLGLGFDSDIIRKVNLKKLFTRYGNKFTEHAANNRNLEEELLTLTALDISPEDMLIK